MGGPEVMREQLRHLRDLMELPRIVVRIIPLSSGPHVGADGAFQVISMDARDVAYAGAQKGGRLIEGAAEVKEFAVQFDHIGAQAASETDSRAIVERYLERWT